MSLRSRETSAFVRLTALPPFVQPTCLRNSCRGRRAARSAAVTDFMCLTNVSIVSVILLRRRRVPKAAALPLALPLADEVVAGGWPRTGKLVPRRSCCYGVMALGA